MEYKYLLIVGLGLLGCSKGEKSTDTQTDTLDSDGVYTALTLDEYEAFYNYDSNAIKSDDFVDLTVDFDCAVLIYPTDEVIDDMKKEYGEEDFYIIADDNNWYQSMAIEMLDSVGIKIVGVHGDSLRFSGEVRTWGFDLKKDSLTGWKLVLFNKKKGPMVVPAIDLTVRQITDYFEIKE